MLLDIRDLHVEVEGKEVLKGVNLKLNTGKVNALMGKNGSGKSTLAYTLMGHPKYKVTKGKITFNGNDITSLPVNERSKLGMFLSFQHPRAVDGVNVLGLIKKSFKERGEKIIFSAKEKLKENGKKLEFSEDFYNRSINKGFSGGEKKKMEILQLLTLNPKLAILDETDSGLDIDSLRTISDGINEFMDNEKGVFLITHYKRILEHIRPDKVFIMDKGKIVKEGSVDIVDRLEKEGYKFLDESK